MEKTVWGQRYRLEFSEQVIAGIIRAYVEGLEKNMQYPAVKGFCYETEQGVVIDGTKLLSVLQLGKEQLIAEINDRWVKQHSQDDEALEKIFFPVVNFLERMDMTEAVKNISTELAGFICDYSEEKRSSANG